MNKLSEVNTVVELPEIFGIIKSPFIFVRPCYPTIALEITKRIKLATLVVVGDPGIGKSMFFLYYFFSLLKEGKGAILVFEDDRWISRLSRKRICGGQGLDKIPGYWSSDQVTLLLDGVAKPFFMAKTRMAVVFSSPEPENYKAFSKNSGSLMFMEPWKLEEVTTMADKMRPLQIDELARKFPNRGLLVVRDPENQRKVVKAELIERYKVIGGRPRLLLQFNVSLTSLKDQLDRCLFDINFESLRKISMLNIAYETPSLAYSINPIKDKDGGMLSGPYFISFASEYVVERVRDILFVGRNADNLAEFLKSINSHIGRQLLASIANKQ